MRTTTLRVDGRRGRGGREQRGADADAGPGAVGDGQLRVGTETLTIASEHGRDPRPGRTPYDYGTALTNAVSSRRDARAGRSTSCAGLGDGGQRAGERVGQRTSMTLTNDAALTWTWGDELPVHGHGGRQRQRQRLDERVVRAGRERDGDGGAGCALPLRGLDGRRGRATRATRR